MSFIERREISRPTTGEAPFQLNETFFSRTDERGIILAANDIFRRVSGYSWDEISGAPHKIIRHPDMPKAVFHMLWSTIQDGKPIAAYVKNLAKDGLHYWVLAVVVPSEDGFLSVRIKPSSGMLDKVEKIYAEIVRKEQEEGLTPEQSASVLIARLADEGFEQYSDFEICALGEELTSKDKILNLPVDGTVQGFERISDAISDLKTETERLVVFFDQANAIPTNLRLLASRIEPSGGPLSSLSENYWKMSQEMTTWFTGFVTSSGNSFSNIQGAVNDAMMLRCATRVLNEASNQFATERRKLGGLDALEEGEKIANLASKYEVKALLGVEAAEREARNIADTINMLRRHILGLSTTRVMCKIESAGLDEGGSNLAGIIGHFESFQKTVEGILEKIDHANLQILSNARAVRALK